MAGKRGENGKPERKAAAASSVSRVRARELSGRYKLLAIDLDGTLLNHDGEAYPEDVDALRELISLGVPVTISRVDCFSGARPSAELLGIAGPVGCADGSHIVHVRGERTLYHRGIRGRAANRLRTTLERSDLIAFLFAEDTIVHDERGAAHLAYVRTWSTELKYAHRVSEHALWDSQSGMTAVVAIGRETSIGHAVADIQRDETEAIQVAMFPLRQGEQWGKGRARIRRNEGHGARVGRCASRPFDGRNGMRGRLAQRSADAHRRWSLVRDGTVSRRREARRHRRARSFDRHWRRHC